MSFAAIIASSLFKRVGSICRVTVAGGVELMPSLGYEIGGHAESCGDASSISGIGLGAVGDVAPLHLRSGITHSASCVVEKSLLLCGRHLAEQDARLLIVITFNAMIPMRGRPFKRQ